MEGRLHPLTPPPLFVSRGRLVLCLPSHFLVLLAAILLSTVWSGDQSKATNLKMHQGQLFDAARHRWLAGPSPGHAKVVLELRLQVVDVADLTLGRDLDLSTRLGRLSLGLVSKVTAWS